jgi:hypothetical protein
MKSRYALMIGALTLVAVSAGVHHSTAGIYQQDIEVQLGKVRSGAISASSLKIEVVDDWAWPMNGTSATAARRWRT